MAQFAKLINGRIEHAPKTIVLPDGRYRCNPLPEDYIQAGWKELVETPMPSKEGFYFVSSWTETETQIIKEWTEKPIPTPEESFESMFSRIMKGD